MPVTPSYTTLYIPTLTLTPTSTVTMSSLEAKIVVLGSQGVGKTSLVMRYCKGAFNPAETISTVGASFMTKRVVDSDTDTVVRLQIWDTGTALSSSCLCFLCCVD